MSTLPIAITAALVAGSQKPAGTQPPTSAPATTQPATSDSLVTQVLAYRDGEVELRGYLAYDKSIQGRRPGVLVVPEWWGLNDFARQEARQIAKLGYIALAVDMYGGGQTATDPAEAGRLAGQFRENSALWRQRARAAYDALSRDERCDPHRLAAIGFCFGGSTVLQLAASGADLTAAVSFHGSLMSIPAADAARIKASILVLHGASDPHVPDENVKAFEDSLRKTDVDWQIIIYGGAKHGFMNPANARTAAEGVGYDELAARRAREQMRAFLKEAFGPAHP